MSSLLDWLKEQASEQLNKATPKVEDGEWFDKLMSTVENQITKAELDGSVHDASMDAINLLNDNKDLLINRNEILVK